ncbi:MAG: TlpA disulfide reductase family protein [Desulfosarcinaceae bacterium]|nr:TlpA disulfide reductase family protein [Desulfosarcinaceae bacterium]
MPFDRHRGTALWVLLILGAALPVWAVSQTAAPEIGDPLPEIALPMPDNPQQAHYLGLDPLNADRFDLTAIAADLVVVEIFSMYCPHCQREAPKVNTLYEALQKRPEAAPRIRLLGIGVGNSPMEVDVFRKTYDIAFPLFSDGDFTIHKQLREVRTPFFLAFRPGDPPPHKLQLAHLGPIDGVDAFVDRLDAIAREQTP